jgi:asparagine synthase (glutamine-hydrolysing)
MDAARLLHPDLRVASHAGRSMALDLAVTDDLPQAEATDRLTALCLRGYTNNQLLRDIDAASMAHSLEVRVPFLDVPLLDLALSLPAQSKLATPKAGGNPHHASYRELGGKRVLMDAGMKHGLLPPEMDLQPKRGFNMPNQEWLMGPMRPILQETLADARIRQRGWLEPRQAAQVRDGFLAGTVAWNRPWLLMMLELWAQQVLDKARDAA